jgi:hypothetical protein
LNARVMSTTPWSTSDQRVPTTSSTRGPRAGCPDPAGRGGACVRP